MANEGDLKLGSLCRLHAYVDTW